MEPTNPIVEPEDRVLAKGICAELPRTSTRTSVVPGNPAEAVAALPSRVAICENCTIAADFELSTEVDEAE